MSNTDTKKKWSKKKKIIVISLSACLVLLVAIICGGTYALNWYCKPVDCEVVSAQGIADEDSLIIAHRGLNAIAPENTVPAFEEAGKANYWGAECDVFRTKDGVWVIHHDFNTFRMMDCAKNIRSTTYEDLLKHNTDNGNGIENYKDLKICTLEEYLEVCKKYNMVAVIELKSNKDTEHYDEILNILNKQDVEYTFISFHEEALQAMRDLSADIPLFYLTSKVDDEAIEIAKRIGLCGIDFDGNKEENFENDSAILKKCTEEGIPLGAWTIDDLEKMQQLKDLGVEIITTNCITYK